MHTPSDHNKVPAIMISTDRGIFINESSVRERMKGYGKKYDSLSIIIFALKKHALPKEDYLVEGDAQNTSGRVVAYSTNAWLRLCYMPRAFWQGMQRINALADAGHKTVHITTQDPFETGLVGVFLAWYGTYVCGLTIRRNVDIHTDIYSLYFRKASLLNRLRLCIAPLTLKNTTTIRVVLERIKKQLGEQSIDMAKIEVRPIALDPLIARIAHEGLAQHSDIEQRIRDIRDTYGQKRRLIFMAGRLAPEKEYPFAFEVYARYKAGSTDTEAPLLVIAGEGAEGSVLKEKGKALFQDTILFLGAIQTKELIAWYKAASVFFHTSRFEGYGMVLKEAVALGTPVVTTDVGIASELYALHPNMVHVFPVHDKDAAVQALRQALTKA